MLRLCRPGRTRGLHAGCRDGVRVAIESDAAFTAHAVLCEDSERLERHDHCERCERDKRYFTRVTGLPRLTFYAKLQTRPNDYYLRQSRVIQ